MTLQVSVGQAAATALANWLAAQFAANISNVTVYDRWPEANVALFKGGVRGVVTVAKTGPRQRLDVISQSIAASVLQSGVDYLVTINLGSFVQPMQLDVWTTTDDDRDDLIAELDGYLNAGLMATLGVVNEDPLRDGVLFPLAAPFVGNVDCWLDEPEIADSPDSIQRAEYRASYAGEARGAFGLQVTVPSMQTLTAALQAYATNPGALYQLATLTPNPSPPPNGVVTYSTSPTP